MSTTSRRAGKSTSDDYNSTVGYIFHPFSLIYMCNLTSRASIVSGRSTCNSCQKSIVLNIFIFIHMSLSIFDYLFPNLVDSVLRKARRENVGKKEYERKKTRANQRRKKARNVSIFSSPPCGKNWTKISLKDCSSTTPLGHS